MIAVYFDGFLLDKIVSGYFVSVHDLTSSIKNLKLSFIMLFLLSNFKCVFLSLYRIRQDSGVAQSSETR